MRHGVGTKSGVGFAISGQSHLHLPDAPGNSTGSSGELPEVWHGVRAENRVSGRERKSRTHRYDAAVLDWRGARTASLPARHGALDPRATPRKLGDGRHGTLDSIPSLNARDIVGGLAFLQARLAFHHHAPFEYVHA